MKNGCAIALPAPGTMAIHQWKELVRRPLSLVQKCTCSKAGFYVYYQQLYKLLQFSKIIDTLPKLHTTRQQCITIDFSQWSQVITHCFVKQQDSFHSHYRVSILARGETEQGQSLGVVPLQEANINIWKILGGKTWCRGGGKSQGTPLYETLHYFASRSVNSMQPLPQLSVQCTTVHYPGYSTGNSR